MKDKINLKKVIPWGLVILWVALIFCLSHQPALESSSLSSGITKMIMNFIEKIFPKGGFNFEPLHHFVRKNAHFFIYLILGIFVSNALKGGVRGLLLGVVICVLYAISDEIHQIFIPGRAGQLMDVLIDSAGSLVGIFLSRIKKRSD